MVTGTFPAGLFPGIFFVFKKDPKTCWKQTCNIYRYTTFITYICYECSIYVYCNIASSRFYTWTFLHAEKSRYRKFLPG